MTYRLSEEQEALVAEARKFVKSEILPVAAAYDASGDFPRDIIRKGHALGLINLYQEAEYGGTGLTLTDACLVIEEIAAGCGGFATSMVANDLALTPVKLAATPEQKKRLLEPVLTNGGLASFCLTEPGAGSDAAGLSSQLVDKGDHYLLTGSKQWITNAGYADQLTVFATLDKTKRHRGICAVVVPAKAQGVSFGHHENKMGQRCSNTVTISFDNVVVPKSDRLGEEGDGFKIAMATLDASRPLTAVIAVGIARAAFEYALAYSQERKQFGQPIASFQQVQALLADMATDIEAARLLTMKSAALHDAGVDATLMSSMAKRFAADAAMKVTTDAVQIYGGYGYTKEYPVEKLMRDAKLMQIYEGTSQIQRIVIARQLLKS